MTLNDSQPTVIAITESWCNHDEPDSMYQLPGYSIHRQDRAGRQGGGVIIYVQEPLSVSHVSTELCDFAEVLWLKLSLAETQICVGCCYRPPQSDEKAFCQLLESSLRAARRESANILLLGDFNAKHSMWMSSDQTSSLGDRLQQLFLILQLNQHVTFPTYIHQNQPSSCLDLIVSSYDSDAVDVHCGPALGNSDHLSVLGTIQLHTTSASSQNRPATSWSWSPRRVAALRSSLATCSILVEPELNNNDNHTIDEMWDTWKSTVLRICRRHCSTHPLQTKRSRPVSQANPWITPELVEQINQKHRLFRAYIRTKTCSDWTAYTKQRNHVSSLLRLAKSDFVCSNSSDGSINKVNLHTIMRGLTKRTKSSIPDLLQDNSVLTDSHLKAEEFNKFFISQSELSASTPQALPHLPTSQVTDTELRGFSTNSQEVEQLLRCIDCRKSAGHDGIPSKLLKLAATELAPSLSHIYNVSFATGTVPKEWKEATVTPIHKKGPASQLTNYRPISLLSVVAKTQERMVHKQLYSFVQDILPVNQSGFRPGDSTSIQLARLLHQVYSDRDAGKCVLICYFDRSKAFDRVSHDGVLMKLAHIGVGQAALQWLSAYLHGRTQRVQVNDGVSSFLNIPAGVPQGSVLGPLLFNIYTFDLPATCSAAGTQCYQFADDTALVASYPTFQMSERHLQESVSRVAVWLKSWRLLVNPEKTCVMHFHHGNRPPDRKPQVTLENHTLHTATCHRHLGLMIQDNLSRTGHVDYLICKASKALGNIFRLRHRLTVTALSYLYTCYVRPIIEYPTSALTTLPQNLSDRVERFQRKAARACLHMSLFNPVNHTSILHRLEWPTLDSRRRRLHYLLLAHSIYHRYAPMHLLSVPVTLAEPPPRCLRNQRVFSIPTTRTSRLRDSPIFASLALFNTLPSNARRIPQRQAFKQEIIPLILSSTCSCSTHPPLPML